MLGDVAVDARFSRDELQRSTADDVAEIGRQAMLLSGDERALHERFLQLLAAQPPPIPAVYRREQRFQERAHNMIEAACASDELVSHLIAFYSRKMLSFTRRWPQGSTSSERRLERLMALLRRLQLALVRSDLRAEMSGVPLLMTEDDARAYLLSLCLDDADRAWLAALPTPLSLPSRIYLDAQALSADARINFNAARAVYVLPEDEAMPLSTLLFAPLARIFSAAEERLKSPSTPEASARPLCQMLMALQRRAVQNAARCRVLTLPRVQLLLRYSVELLRHTVMYLAALAALPPLEQLSHWKASPCALLLPALLPSLLALDFVLPSAAPSPAGGTNINAHPNTNPLPAAAAPPAAAVFVQIAASASVTSSGADPQAQVQSHMTCFGDLATPLEQLVPALCRLAQASPDTDAWAREEARRGREVWPPVEIESAHPYMAGTDEAHHVHIPGAAYLLVAFDQRCSTEKGDTVHLYKRAGRVEPIGMPMSGRHPNEWPGGAVLVEGDSLTLAFTAGAYGSATLYGYRVLVRAVPFDAPRSALYDLLSSATLLAAKSFASLMHEPRSLPDEAPLEMHISLLIYSAPSSATTVSASRTFAIDLADLRAASPAAEAWAARAAQPQATHAAAVALDRIERLAAAAMVLHTCATALSPALLRAARQVRDWSASQRQRWNEAGETDAVLPAIESRVVLLLASAVAATPATLERLLAFLCLSVRPSLWHTIMARRVARARNRTRALKAFAALASLRLPHLPLLLLTPLTASLTDITHPLCGVRGTEADERAVYGAWASLLHNLSPVLCGPLMAVLCVAWGPEDVPLLVELQLFPRLCARLTEASLAPLERGALEHLIRYLALRITDTASAPSPLHGWLVSHLTQHLLVPRLARVAPDGDALSEHLAYFAASLLLLLSKQTSCTPLFQGPPYVQLAHQLEQCTSPRLKRIGVRLLTRCVDLTLPLTAFERPLPEELFARLAMLLAEEQWAPHATHEARYDHAADIAGLLRHMHALPAWQARVATLVTTPLEWLALATPLTSPAQLGALLASLSILGGTVERLRSGVRVEVSGEKAQEAAVLVAYDQERALARVSPCAAPANIAFCERTRLTVHLTPAPSPSLFSQPLLSLLAAYLLRLPALPPQPTPQQHQHTLNSSAPVALVAAVVLAPSPTPSRSAPRVVSKDWDCELCTLHNVAGASLCAVCEAPAPPSAFALPLASPASRPTTPQPPATSLQAQAPPHRRSLSSSTSAFALAPAVLSEQAPSLTQFAEQQLGWRVALALSHGLTVAPPSVLTALATSSLIAALAVSAARAGPLHEPRPLHALLHLHDIGLDRLANQLAHAGVYAHAPVLPLERATDALVASPFKGADLLLPTCWHRGSARHTTFPHTSLLTTRARGPAPLCGIVRADYPVPASLPVFYFEITLEAGVAVALGVWREGVPLDGLPGDGASFAYAAASGTKHHGDGADAYTDCAVPGDTLGCLYDQRRHTIAFTRNGTLLPVAFTGVNGRLVPVLWLLSSDTLVHANFGQRAFRLNLAPLLPSDAVPRVQRAPMSEAQMRREAMAEELRAMMGEAFPLALCSTALERSRDSMDAAAAWLLERGYAEMDRVARELIAQTESEHLDAVKRLSMQDSNNAPPPALSASSSHVDLTASVEDDTEAEADEDARAAARLLDDQLGLERPLLAQDAPLPTSFLPLRLSDLQIGMYVECFLPTSASSSSPATRLARLLSVDFDLEMAQVEVLSGSSTGLLAILTVPAAALRRCASPSRTQTHAHTQRVQELHAEVCWQGEALALQCLRKALLSVLVSCGASLLVNTVGGAQPFSHLLKLLSAEFLAARAPDAPAAAAARDARRPFEELRTRIALALAGATPEALEGMPTALQLNRGDSAPRWCTEKSSLLCVLVEECVAHVVRAVEVPPPVDTLESAHPYPNHASQRRKLHIPGAAALLVRFDPRTHLHPNDPLTSLVLFRDAANTQAIATMRGAAAQDPQAWAPVVNAGDTLYVRFTSGAGSTFWGYRLTVVPLLLHVSDATALTSGNFPLALWLFSLLLDAPPPSVSSRYVPELYRALLFYIRHARRAAKGAGLQLLTRLLGHMRTFPPIEPVVQASDVATFRRLLERRQEAEGGARVAGVRAQPYSPRLQSLAELLAAAELAVAAHSPLPMPVTPISPMALRALAPRLALVSAGPDTAELTAKLNADGGAVLQISNAPRRINVLYQVTHALLPNNHALHTAEVSVARAASRVIAADQLDPVTSVASAVSALVAGAPLPFPMAAPALLRSAFLAIPYVRLTSILVPAVPLSPVQTLWAPPHVDALAISMWLTIAPDAPAQTRRLLARDASPAWSVSLDAQKRLVVQANGQSLTSRAPLPVSAPVHVLVHLTHSSHIALFLGGAPDAEKRFALPRAPMHSAAVLTLGEASRVGVLISDARIYSSLVPAASVVNAGMRPSEPEAPLPVPVLETLVRTLPRLTLPLLQEAAVLLQSGNTERTDQWAVSYPRLAPLSTAEVAMACEAVQQVNALVSQVLPLVDLAQHTQPWSLAAQLAQLKGAVLFTTKTSYLDALLTATATRAPRPAVTISRPRALKVRERGGDSVGKHSVFGQLFRALHFSAPESLRQSGVTWSVTYAGEGGTDAGGLFRDSMSHVCAELQDSVLLPLLMPCPNARSRVGSCQERWLIRASSDSALHLDMFAFLGKLLGIALRGRHALPLDLHPYIWRCLVGASHTPAQALEELDAALANSLDALETYTGDEASFALLFAELTWTITAPDGSTADLCAGGATREVKYSERAVYARTCRDYLLSYGRAQLDAMRSGLATVVPLPLLVLFTAQELELACCGSSDVNLELLRENTKYSDGAQEGDMHVQWMWRMLAAFTTKQRQQFLRFVWGRSRLPLRSAHFEQKFVVLPSPRSNDLMLPGSRTCFFQLELPRYSTYEVMYAKFVYAITEGIAIDADHRAQDLNWDQALDDREPNSDGNDDNEAQEGDEPEPPPDANADEGQSEW